MPTLIELTCIFRYERHRWDSTVIADCEDPGNHEPLVVKAVAEDGELVTGLTYRFYGRYRKHPKYGPQFHAQTFVRSQPHGMAGVIRYLMQAPHVGQATAAKLWEAFQGDAVRFLRERPDVAAAAGGGRFSEAKAREAAEWLKGEQALEDCTIDLINLLGGLGFPRNTGKKAVGEWGNKAAELIKRNPYLLMRFRGCGFLRCDKLFLNLGGDPAKLKRQAYCAWHAAATDTDGHTWLPVDIIEKGLRGHIGGARVQGPAAVKLAVRGKLLSSRRDDAGRLWLSERRRADNEAAVARHIARLSTGQNCWPTIVSLDISDHQISQLGGALDGPVGFFGGGPGTGKTYTLARLVAKVAHRHGIDNVAVAAPTGKAAVRVSELMEGYGVPAQARTIHSLLRVQQRTEGEGWGFTHNEGNPLPHRWVFVDESSMIDTDLQASLLRACADGTHVLFVGDTAQLPPVGHGAPLRDLIAAGLPYGELTEIRRNSGSIVRACHAIRSGQRFQTDEQIDLEAGLNLRLLGAGDNAAAAARIIEALTGIRTRGLADPIWDCQVVVAVNRKSELSRRDLNRRLQAELNAGGRSVRGNPFRVGDKIVNTKNGFFPRADGSECDDDQADGLDDDGKVFVANGELARVADVTETLVIVNLNAPERQIKIPRGNGDQDADGDDDKQATGTGCSWDLGYALSVHKSQGSEWPIVLVGLDEYPGARLVCGREWLYTAISRAQRLCCMVGKLATAHSMTRRVALAKRKTFLREDSQKEE